MKKFPLRANASKTEPLLQSDEQWSQFLNSSGESYFLHDGPPYANGEVHLGHAVNKVLKDFVLRSKELQDISVNFVPGHDTHGLPTEMAAKKLNPGFENLFVEEKRTQCQQLAQKNLKKQQKSFKRLGVKGDYDHAYVTMSPEYEAAQLEAFGELYFRGFLYQDYQPVWYSPSSKTVLANAELEYQQRTGVGVYFPFKVVDRDLTLVVWTTQPWTLYGNQAVCVNPISVYKTLHFTNRETNKEETFVVSEECVKDFLMRSQNSYHFNGYGRRVTPQQLNGLVYFSPLNNQHNRVFLHKLVNPHSGTGLLHVCPAHGLEDWEVGQEFNLSTKNLLDEDCLFQGLNPLSEKFSESKLECFEQALFAESYTHSYPYDWRTKEPVVMMSRLQWFFNLDKTKELSKKVVEEVEWDTPSAKKRFTSMLDSRKVWPVSRQRTWGLPLPFFYHKETGFPFQTREGLNHLVSVFRDRGSNAWWELSTEELFSEQDRHLAKHYCKGFDTMDVWLDSGLSWYVVNKTHGLPFQANMYLEGSDQHRGWFQSSFLTSVALTGQAPFKKLVTHGFVLDQDGKKMSKSVGNVVDPMDVVTQYSADVFRLWVAGTDYRQDMSFSDSGMKTAFDRYKEMRGFLRFCCNNLFDTDKKSLENLSKTFHTSDYQDKNVDLDVLQSLEVLAESVLQPYSDLDFSKALHLLEKHRSHLSANWLQTETTGLKERLYRYYPDTQGNADDLERRYGQYVLYKVLLTYASLLDPLTPHLTAELRRHLKEF